MKKLIFSLFCAATLFGLTVPISLVSEADETVTEAWVAVYNGPANGNDYPQAIAIDSSGNIYVTGWSGPTTGSYGDYATVRYSMSAQASNWRTNKPEQ